MRPIVASEEQNSMDELLISFRYKIRLMKLMNHKTLISKEKFLRETEFSKLLLCN